LVTQPTFADHNLFGRLDPVVDRILGRSLDGHDVTVEEGEALFGVHGRELQATSRSFCESAKARSFFRL
jgi:hypothetical protein